MPRGKFVSTNQNRYPDLGYRLLVQVPSVNTLAYGHRSFSRYAPIIWNGLPDHIKNSESVSTFKVARYSFSRSIPPKFERKLRRHKQGFGKIDTTVVLDKDENWL